MAPELIHVTRMIPGGVTNEHIGKVPFRPFESPPFGAEAPHADWGGGERGVREKRHPWRTWVLYGECPEA